MKNEINESVYDINMDKLCQNSIELIKYARNITAKQVNNVQIMTYYSLGRWIVEVQQQGKHRAEYGKKIIINLSKINRRIWKRLFRIYAGKGKKVLFNI